MTRRRKLLLLGALAALLVGTYAWWRLPHWTATVLQARLSIFFGRTVTVGDVRFHYGPFRIEIAQLTVGGPTADAPPFIDLPRAWITPSLSTMLEPHLVLSELLLERPSIRIRAFRQGGDDIPRTGGGPGGGLTLQVQHLAIRDGEFDLNHERVPLTLELPDFLGQLEGRAGGVLAGRIEFGPGRLRFSEHPRLPVKTRLDLVIDGPHINVREAHILARGTDLVYTGDLHLTAPRPSGLFQIAGPVDLDLLDTHLMRTGFGIQGDGRFDGTVHVDGPRLSLAGRLYGTAGVFDGVPVPQYDGHLTWDQRGVILTGLEVQTLGGSGRVDLDVPPRPAPSRLKAEMRDVDGEGLVAAVFDIGTASIGAKTTGSLDIAWPRGQIRRLSGRLDVDLRGAGDGRTPLEGRFEWRAEEGVQFIEKARLHTPATGVRLSGRVEIDDRADLQVDGESRDLRATDDLGRRVRLALGNPDAALAGFGGVGVFRGRWTGTLQEPIFTGRIAARQVDYLGVRWGEAAWSGVATTYRVSSNSLVVRRSGAELWVDGFMEIGDYGLDDALDLRVRFDAWPVRDLITALQWDLDLDGPLVGRAALRGRRSDPHGDARLTMTEGRYYGIPFEELQASSSIENGLVQVSTGRARVGGGRLTFHGTGSFDGLYDGAAELTRADIGVMPPLLPQAPWGGPVSGRTTLKGPVDHPRLVAHATSPRLFMGDEGLCAVDARLRGSGDGRVQVDGTCRSPRVDLAVSGAAAASAPYDVTLKVTARDTSMDPFLRQALPALPSTVAIVAGGRLNLSGSPLQPAAVQADAVVSELAIRLPEYRMTSPESVHVELRDGQLTLHETELAGDGTALRLSARASLLDGQGPLRAQVNGAADLRALPFPGRQVRTRGAAHLGLLVSGTVARPTVEGLLALEGAGFRLRGFPHGVESLRGVVNFTEKSLSFSDVRGTLGGGELTLDGQAVYGADSTPSFEVTASGRRMKVRYPRGLRSELDADIRVLGDATRQWLGGDVRVREAVWTRRYELASELLAGSDDAHKPDAASEGSLGYDLKVRIPGTLRIENNLATLRARADLTLQGHSHKPVIVGQATVDHGRVYFQGNTYVISHGTIDFPNPRQTEPLFDIEAETQIRSYRVMLKANGTLDKVYPTLTSDPPLSAVQILNLLAGADEATVASLNLSQADQASLAAAGAATLAAGRISEEVGLERGAERLFGLSRFSIDPSVVRGGVANPTARLTVGKRLTSDVNLQYSIDLRGTEERILSLEVTLSDRLSLLLNRVEPGDMGFDLRLRRTY